MNYFRITAYHPKHDLSAILDAYGKYDELWEFSAYLISKGFKIIEVGANENIIDGTLQSVAEPSDKILVRGVARGRPIVQDMKYDNRPCKGICVNDMSYALF